MNPMDKLVKFPGSVLAPLRDYLLRQQQKLLKQKDSLQKEDPFTDVARVDDNADIGTEATEQWGHQRIEALRSEIDKALINIRKALTKIKIGKYGLCERCGRLIDTDRLAINPTARFCMSCEKELARSSAKSRRGS